MMPNATFWSRYSRAVYVPQVDAIVEALERRVLPGFESIEREAEEASDRAWKAFMEQPGTGDEDPSDFAEAAEQVGVSRYMLLSGVRQGLINLFAAGLFHVFEQQAMELHRRELLPRHEEGDRRLLTLQAFVKRLLQYGIDVRSFPSWQTIHELRVLANAVKHAEGRATKDLFVVRPDLFQNPFLKNFSMLTIKLPQVFQPLVGEDIYVRVDDVRKYGQSIKDFWQQLSDALQNA